MSQTPASNSSASAVTSGAIVKQVLSGDTIIIRGQPKGGPPPERTIGLTHLTAPKLARRANPNSTQDETKDEPYAWEAREYLRKKLLGKETTFVCDYKVPNSAKEFGWLYLGKDINGENINYMMVSEGYAEVRKQSVKANDESSQHMLTLEDEAKAACKGKWAAEPSPLQIRDVKWTLDNARQFVDSHHGKPIKAVIEHVRDGSTIRAFLLPSFQYVTVMLSGLRSPMCKGVIETSEAYAEEAKFFVESRLLNRDVEIILEGVAGGGAPPTAEGQQVSPNLLGTVLHPNGNISELLLREGLARCVDWSMAVVSQGMEKLRLAEKFAKENKKRIWTDYKPSVSTLSASDKNFTAKVIEVVNGESLVVQYPGSTSKKIFLSSIRSPRADSVSIDKKKEAANEAKQKIAPTKRSQDINDIPFFFEAREFLRKKLVGKKVNVIVDYIQPPNQGFPEKSCCTVNINGVNISEALVSKGFATVLRYRQDDDQRSAHYDELLAAELKAKKSQKGLFSKPESWPTHRIADVTGDANKAKQFLPFLQRAGRSEAVVEFVASGSRTRLYVPKETCLITFLLSGISCPRGSRPMPGNPTLMMDAEPFGDEAHTFTRDMCMQHEVLIEVETMDRAGNFIGWLFIDGTNLSVALVQAGLASVHSTAERSKYYPALLHAENDAKIKKLKIWEKYVEPDTTNEANIDTGPSERNVSYQKAVISYVTGELEFYAQLVDDGPRLEEMMNNLHQSFLDTPPVTGAYVPKKGDMCAAKYIDGGWYRARVEKLTKSSGGNVVTVFFIDYGNREEIKDANQLAALPTTFSTYPAYAHQYALACIRIPPEAEDADSAVEAFKQDVEGQTVSMNIEYRISGSQYCTVVIDDKDIGKGLVREGLLLVDARRERRLASLVTEYKQAQDHAKQNRLCLWRYGDFLEDDAKEFGMGN